MEIGYSCIYSNSMDIIFNKYIKHKSNNHILKEIIDFFIYGACVELRFGGIFTLQKFLPFTPFLESAQTVYGIPISPKGYQELCIFMILVSLGFLEVRLSIFGVSWGFVWVSWGTQDVSEIRMCPQYVLNLYYSGIIGVPWGSLVLENAHEKYTFPGRHEFLPLSHDSLD